MSCRISGGACAAQKHPATTSFRAGPVREAAPEAPLPRPPPASQGRPYGPKQHFVHQDPPGREWMSDCGAAGHVRLDGPAAGPPPRPGRLRVRGEFRSLAVMVVARRGGSGSSHTARVGPPRSLFRVIHPDRPASGGLSGRGHSPLSPGAPPRPGMTSPAPDRGPQVAGVGLRNSRCRAGGFRLGTCAPGSGHAC